MLVRAVLFAGCDHETFMLGRWPSKRPHFTTERVECCDHGLYTVCAVAGSIFCCSSFFFATEWPLQKCSHRKLESEAWAGEIVLGSFQALEPPYLAAAGRQKIHPQEMRIWGLGLRNCFREFSGTCVPLSGRTRPPKNPATGNENLSLAKLSEIPAGTFFIICFQAEEL